MNYEIKSVSASHASDIANIYNYYVSNSIATFEEELVSTAQIQQRINSVIKGKLPWLVIMQADPVTGKEYVLGYAYASQWKERAAYRFSVEVSIYLAANQEAKGLGTKLYSTLFTALKSADIHAIIAGISLPNQASIALHEKFGFEKSAHFSQVGFKFNQWIDVGYWQVRRDKLTLDAATC
ncbi:N-acetyltransferase family protein [Litorilituus sediminis]|uniref:GNAT family N-acetyltransferase n=1 Tax=Litorilituus sediminis TaxID=718192 RepID=UPI003CCC7E5D